MVTAREAPDVGDFKAPMSRTDELLEASRRLRPLIEAHADEGERNFELSDVVARALNDDGIMSAMVPAELGGTEAHPVEIIDSIVELTYADPSTGWVALATMAGTGGTLSGVGDDAVETILGSDNYLAVGQAAIGGRAYRVDGGWRASGKFAFGSGAAHAGWFIGGFHLYEDESTPVLDDAGNPKVTMLVAPRGQVDLLGNWDVIGLVATGSFDYALRDQIIPDSFSMQEGGAKRGGPLGRMATRTRPALGHGAFPIGCAWRILDEFKEIARTKSRPPNGVLALDTAIQRDVGEWTAQLWSARSWLRDSFSRLYDEAAAGRVASLEMKSDARLACTHSAYVGAKICEAVYLASGSVGLRSGSLINRCYRDMHAATQHMFTGSHIYVEAGRLFLDVPGLTDAHRDLMRTSFTPPLPR